MLFPDMVHFSPSEIPVLEEFMDDLNALGFDLSSLGGVLILLTVFQLELRD